MSNPYAERTRKQHEAILRVLKKRFNNLSAEEINALAWDILLAVETIEE